MTQQRVTVVHENRIAAESADSSCALRKSTSGP